MKKFELLVPLAGRGLRMVEGGYTMPKPLIMAGDRTILDWSMESIDTSECNITFVILKEHAYNYDLLTILKSKYPDSAVAIVDDYTRGTLESCYNARFLVDSFKPLIIFCPDVAFRPVFKPTEDHFNQAGFILTFKANSPNYSYVLKERFGWVTETREKTVISQDAAVGVYCFQSANLFFKQAAIALTSKQASEFYICPLYNQLIDSDLEVQSAEIDSIYIMGTPKELNFFERAIFPYINGPREFIVCSDHSGFDVKQEFIAAIRDIGIKVIDCGCWTNRDCDYSDFLFLAQKYIKNNPGAYGLGFCRSGQGINIAANKIPGIRSALITDEFSASLAIQHNNANFFAIAAGRLQTYAPDIVSQLVLSRFQGGRHQNRLEKYADI